MAKNFFQSKARCDARHPRIGERCMRQLGHLEKHTAKAPNGMLVDWTGAYMSEDEYRTEENILTFKGPLESWRWWRFAVGGRLMSITANTVWDGPVMTTKPAPNNKPARVAYRNPMLGGGGRTNAYLDFGVYSYKSPALLREFNPGLFRNMTKKDLRNEPLALGRLHNHGHVVEHEYGFRSQKVSVQEIWIFVSLLTANVNPWRNSMSKRYDCEVHIVEQSKIEGFIKFYSDSGDAPDDDELKDISF